MDENLTLANGTTIKGHLIDTGNVLFLYLHEISMRDAFDLLIVPENTETVQFERNGQTGTVTGYNHLYSISEENGGMISAALRSAE